MAARFPQPQSPDRPDRARTFFTRFLKSPRAVASPFESSERMVQSLLEPLDWTSFEIIVEYGPGTGSFTRYALEHMRRDARLFAIDTDPAFTESLSQNLDDPRLTALTGAAENVGAILGAHGVAHADLIISGVPFSSLEPRCAARILAQTEMLLGQTGLFAAYQVRSTLGRMLHQRFATLKRSYEWRNVPPCHLYWATNAASGV
jgi:phospholipid N-methyltransferase